MATSKVLAMLPPVDTVVCSDSMYVSMYVYVCVAVRQVASGN